MRRLVPWALVVLVGVAGVIGAFLGLASQPSMPSVQPSLAVIVATTRSEGTARFTYSSITSSSNPFLRSRSAGRGAVDFRTNSMTTVERDRETQISHDGNGPSRRITQTLVNDQIFIGRRFYTQLDIVSSHLPNRWIKGNFPRGSFGLLGVLDEVGPVGVLDGGLSAHGTRIELVGHETLGGAAVTKYRVVVPACTTSTRATGPREVMGPTDVWLDGEGRLVQVRDVMHITDSAEALTDGGSTINNTIRLSDFGAPVTIATPKVLPEGEGEGAVAFLVSINGCPY